MNFGERLKQIRTTRGLTQPQFAEMAGIEQSYLSKLENDKSVPSAEMFDTIVSALAMDAAAFLDGIDRQEQLTTLRHIPAVTQHRAQAKAAQLTHSRRWLYGAAAAWIAGIVLVLAAHEGLFFPTKFYNYYSDGVLRHGESQDLFRTYRKSLREQRDGGLITEQELAKRILAFEAQRVRHVSVEWPYDRGTVYFEPAENGYRRFDRDRTVETESQGNRALRVLGGVLFACGFIGVFMEWWLRRLNKALC